MLSTLLQFQPDTARVEQWQSRVSWIVLLTFIVVCIIALFSLKYRIRSDEERRQLESIRPQLLSGAATKAHLQASNPGVERRDTLRRLFAGDVEPEPGVRESVRNLYADLVHQRTDLPPVVMRAVLEAVALFAAGVVLTVAVLTVDGWLAPSGGSLSVVIEGIVLLAVLLWVAIQFILGVVPGAEALLALRDPMTGAIGALVAAWVLLISAAIVRATVSEAGQDTDWLALLREGRSLVAEAEEISPDLARAMRWQIGKTLAIRAVFRVVRWAAGLVLATVAASMIIDGHLAAAGRTVIDAGPVGWVGAGAGLLLAAAVLLTVAPERAVEVRTALGRGIRSAAIRTRWLIFGAPLVLVTVTILVVASFTSAWLPTIAAAIAVGVVTRSLTAIYARLRYRVQPPERIQTVNEVEVTAQTVEDADGQPIYVLEIDEYGLAHRDLDALLDTAVDAVSWRLDRPLSGDGGRLPVEPDSAPTHMPAVEHYYFEEMSEQGRVDYQDVRRSLRGDIETRVKSTIENNGGEADKRRVLSELVEEYPADAVRESIDFLRYETGQITTADGQFILR